MSPRIFHQMKNPDDAYYFFKAMIQYYDRHIEKYCEALFKEAMKLDRNIKHLISTTKLSGLVTLPMKLLFVFDDVNITNRNTFKIPKDEINTINKFMHNIPAHYFSPEKEKKAIIDDIETMIKSFKEYCEIDDTIMDLSYLPEAVSTYFNDGYKKEIADKENSLIKENTDYEWLSNPPSREIKYLQEKFGVKKLKKIPRDIVAYITIETECIKDANDKMMISSYCLGKIEIVEWYIELLEVGSKKYIVPHDKPYLESLRTQLLACFKKIMDTPIPKSPSDRPLIDIKYPKGYEG